MEKDEKNKEIGADEFASRYTSKQIGEKLQTKVFQPNKNGTTHET